MLVVLTQVSLCPEFPHGTGTLALLCELSALPAPYPECRWTTQLPGFVSSSSGHLGPEDTLHRGQGHISALCLTVGKLGSQPGKTHLRV